MIIVFPTLVLIQVHIPTASTNHQEKLIKIDSFHKLLDVNSDDDYKHWYLVVPTKIFTNLVYRQRLLVH